MRCKMKDLGARSERALEGLELFVMNLCCDHKIAEVDCWLSGCRRHFAPSPRYAKIVIAYTPIA